MVVDEIESGQWLGHARLVPTGGSSPTPTSRRRDRPLPRLHRGHELRQILHPPHRHEPRRLPPQPADAGRRRHTGRNLSSASCAYEATNSPCFARTSPLPWHRPCTVSGLRWRRTSHSSVRIGSWNQTVCEVTDDAKARPASACDTAARGRSAVPMRVRSVAYERRPGPGRRLRVACAFRARTTRARNRRCPGRSPPAVPRLDLPGGPSPTFHLVQIFNKPTLGA